jgi:hypothetical protein
LHLVKVDRTGKRIQSSLKKERKRRKRLTDLTRSLACAASSCAQVNMTGPKDAARERKRERSPTLS